MLDVVFACRNDISHNVMNNYTFSVFFQFVTRAVRVIDLITNLDMAAFQTHGGLSAFINRLEVSKYLGRLASC